MFLISSPPLLSGISAGKLTAAPVIRGILATLFRYDGAPRSSLVRFWDSKRKRPARGSVYFLIVSLFWVCSAYPLAACTPPDCCWLDATWLPIDFHKMKDVSVVPCGARPFGAPHCRGHERRARFRMDIVPMVAFCIPPSLSTALWSAS